MHHQHHHMEVDGKVQCENALLLTKDRKDLESRSNPSSLLEGAQDSGAAEPSAIITPGAVAMRGSNIVGRSNSTASLDLDEDEHHDRSTAQNSDYVIPATAVRTVTNDMRRSTSMSNNIIAQVRDAVLKDTVQAEIVKDDSKKAPKNSPLSWRKVGIYATLAVVVVGVAIFLLVFILVRDKETSPTSAPPSSPLSPPSSTDTQSKDPSCIYCVENATYDFPLRSSLSIIQLLDAAPSHTTFSEILNITGIKEYLNADDYHLTLFAPTNEAFDALPVPYRYYVVTFDWIYHLETLTFSHMAHGSLNSTEIFGYDELPAGGWFNLFNLTVDRANKTIADLAKILIADVPASNGYIHVPDRVLLIDELRSTLLHTAKIRANESGFSIFQKLIEFAQMEEILVQVLRYGLTLFVPSDSAFDALDQEFVDGLTLPGNENKTRDIVLFHLVRFNFYDAYIIQNLDLTEVGDISYNNLSLWFTADTTEYFAFVNTARIQKQHLAQNGLINVIDKVLMPPNIDDLLRTTTNVTARYSFETFLGIVHGPAKMSEFFTQDGPLTLFAPLEVAFNSVSDQLNRWLEPGWLLHLQSVVRHHCVAQEIRNSELHAGEYTYQTLSGFDTTIQALSNGTTDDLGWVSLIEAIWNGDDLSRRSVVAGKYFGTPSITLEDGPNVTLKNLFAVNGIIYGIDGVLLPPWTKYDIHQTLAQKTDFSTFIVLAELSNLTSFLVGSGPFTVLAPNNTAWAEVVGDHLEASSAANITMIREVLLRHMFVGNLYTAQLNASVVSQSGETIQVRKIGDKVFVNGARIVERDMLCNNGVVHVIDQVLQ